MEEVKEIEKKEKKEEKERGRGEAAVWEQRAALVLPT